MYKVGFTATRHGLTPLQKEGVYINLETILSRHIIEFSIERKEVQFHHGKCKGGDRAGLSIAKQFDFWTVAHPSDLTNWTFFDLESDEERSIRPPLERDYNIVNECDIVIACPFEMDEVRRSGTWSTIRCAKRLNKLLVVIYPK